jgi:lipoprotein-anchoring transpeptidase ErfK/SrfK
MHPFAAGRERTCTTLSGPRSVDSRAVPRLRFFLLSLVICLTVAAPAVAKETAPPTPVAPTEAVIQPGVKLAGVDVGGMTHDQAVAAVQPLFTRPITLRIGARKFTIAPGSLSQDARVAAAMGRAFAAAPGDDVAVYVAYDKARFTALMEHLLKKTTRPAVDAKWILGGRPRVQAAEVGRAVDTTKLRFALIGALQRPLQRTVKVARVQVDPAVQNTDLPPAILIDRGAHRLTLFRAGKFGKTVVVRILGVAVGQSAYPTPSGLFEIVNMQRNPWWYPPDSAWAEGADPIPPGPSNPLGTRWMGISSPGVGMHGTPNPASIGYSASHGCIRLRIPDAEWLFQRVQLGVPVRIV